jgi:hypothetical protein
MEEGYSYGYNNARDAVSLTPRRQVEPLLLPDQFMNLPRLSAYIKFPDGFPAAPVSLIPRSRDRIAEGYIPREIPPAKGVKGRVAASATTRKSSSEADGEHPASNDDGAGKPVDPKQLKLNLPGPDRPVVEARDRPETESREQLEVRRQPGEAKPEASADAAVAASPTLPLSAVQTGEDAAVSNVPQDKSEADIDGVDDRKMVDPSRQNRSHESGTKPIKPAEKDLREGAVSDPPAKDFGEFEPDM